MTTPAFYRGQAEGCRKQARETAEADRKATLLALAEDYVRLAEELEKSPEKKS